MKNNNLDTSKIMYRSEELMSAASNRYRITVQVANRAKRRRYEELENFDDPRMKPVIRAIIEMSDELNQPGIITEDNISVSSSFSKTKLNNKSPLKQSNSSSLSRSELDSKSLKNKQYLQLLKRLADPQSWNMMVGWVSSSVCRIDLDAARISTQRLIDKHPTKSSRQIAEILFLHKSAQVAGVDLVRAIPYSEQIIRVLSGWDLPSVAKLCTEMVFQIAIIYQMEQSLEEQKLQITNVFALALLNEQAINAKFSLLKQHGELTTQLLATGLSALAKATMVCAIANSACVFFEHQSLVAAGETDKLLTKAGSFLFGVSGSHAIQNKIDIKLSKAKELTA